ncbi:hypothetical protein Trydic_g21687 [Trypoxylus dichotomus]
MSCPVYSRIQCDPQIFDLRSPEDYASLEGELAGLPCLILLRPLLHFAYQACKVSRARLSGRPVDVRGYWDVAGVLLRRRGENPDPCITSTADRCPSSLTLNLCECLLAKIRMDECGHCFGDAIG